MQLKDRFLFSACYKYFIIMQLKDHFLLSACYKYFTNNEDVSGSEEAV